MVDAMRRAADPNIVEQALALLSDNALTRGWGDAVTNAVIRPTERLFNGIERVSEDTQMQLARRLAGELDAYGGFTPQTLDLMQKHLPGADVRALLRMEPKLRNIVQEYAKTGRVIPLDQIAQERAVQVADALDQMQYRPGRAATGNIDEGLTLALRDAVLEGAPSRAYTEGGELMRQYGLGSPLVAYGAAGAAGYGGVKGIEALLAMQAANQAEAQS